ncbi:MAG: type II secretion system F family protein [Thermogutta sp.]|uniref:type II secretion system F family protein n=1 Tax=Thermogutta sp. TaxID=1962930 RepID=UPI0019B823F1|nr:type II secretion system F family protein [Thermogutta sp.]MBC7352999.1 type II secretion system F family protein [Thermogutta sp.]
MRVQPDSAITSQLSSKTSSQVEAIKRVAQRLNESSTQIAHAGAVEDDDEDEVSPLIRVRSRDLISTTQQLAILVESGVTLAPALAAAIEEERNSAMRAVLRKVKESVEAGQDFSYAVAQFPRVFSATFVALAKAGEKTGSLGSMLRRAAGYMQAEYETRAKIRSAMIYPAIMLIMSIAVTAFLLTFVLPKFVPVFESRHAKLPKITVAMLALSDFAVKYGPVLIATAGGLATAGYIFRRTKKGREWFDVFKLHVPLLGAVTRKVALSRSVRTLGTLLASGISVLEAIELAAEIAENTVVRRAWLSIKDGLIEGRRMCDCMKQHPIFPRSLVQMVAAGEETGNLDAVLERTAEFYERELETTIKTVTSLIEPAMIIVMGVVVGTIGLSLLLPIFSLSRPA